MNNLTLSRLRLPLLIVLLTALAVAAASLGLRHLQAQGTQPDAAPAPLVVEARVNVSSLNLRTGPHVSYTAVAYLMDGEKVKLVGRNRAATWAQVELYNGYRGWVNARYLQPGVNIAALPVADVALLGITAFVKDDPIPVYAGPDAATQRLGAAQPGDVLALNGRNDAATWIHVYLPDGRAGWVAADSPFLPSAALNDLPIITPFLDAPPPELAAFYLVYTGPGFLYEPVDSVVEGQTLGIRGRTADARWVLVRLDNGREGWIAAEIIQVAVPLENVPVIEGIAPPQVVGWQMAGGATAAPTTAATAQPAATATATATTASSGGGKGSGSAPATAAATAAATAVATAESGGKGASGNLPATATGAATATEAATARPTTAATATARPTLRPTSTPAATATPPPTITPQPTTPATHPPATATTPPQTTGDAPPTAPSVVYVYATPSEDAAPILRVVPGQSVVLIGRTADSQWLQIWLPGDQQGWIHASAVQVDIDVSVLPVVEP